MLLRNYGVTPTFWEPQIVTNIDRTLECILAFGRVGIVYKLPFKFIDLVVIDYDLFGLGLYFEWITMNIRTNKNIL